MLKPERKRAGCPVCGKVVTIRDDGTFNGHNRPTYRYAGSVVCEGVQMRNDDPLVDDRGRLVFRAANTAESLTVLPELIAETRTKLAKLEADLVAAPARAEKAAAELAAFNAAHPDAGR